MRLLRPVALAALLLAAAAARAAVAADGELPPRLPWREAGWSERQAAAHLLDRLTFGARPGEVDRVVAAGLERWVESQLDGGESSPRLDAGLARLPAVRMSAREIAETYPPPPLLLRRAERDGVVSGDELDDVRAGGAPGREAVRRVRAWMEREGLAPERELLAQTAAQKLLRATLSENQLQEVLVDFWFNHFSVSALDPQVRTWILAFERDAIRPHVLGRFRDLLGASARHPAMLLYLDNATSVAPDDAATTLEQYRSARRGARRPATARARASGAQRPNRPTGLNENYARELLELHTLGVDGGYTQSDVVEVARAFSGWTLVPRARLAMGEDESARRKLARVERSGGAFGFVVDGDFLFRADAHDAGEKSVLGHRIAAGGGVEDGERVLDRLAAHPATARHLARKLAVRFIADEPPAPLVERLAGRFEASGGDLRAVTRALLESPEFWARETRAAKIKSPFELVVSALRSLGAELADPLPLLDRLAAMGQPLYAAPAPTGFPERAEGWIASGALVARMNFGLELAAGRIPGVRFDLAASIGGREPESAAAALDLYGRALLPERDLEATRERLAPLLGDPQLAERLAERTAEPPPLGLASLRFDIDRGERTRGGGWSARLRTRLFPPALPMSSSSRPPTAVEEAVGLLVGSPEFQAR